MECPFDKLHPSQLSRDDEFFMSLAYNEAIEAWREDEVPVGAVVTLNGNLVGAAHNSVISTGDPTAHAEILAISQAARAVGDYRLNAVTLYVTKEPCPMCAGAMVMSRVGRVVFGFGDPKMGFLGGAASVLDFGRLNHRPLVEGGVLESPCRDLVQAFFSRKRSQDGPDGENGSGC